MLVSELIELLQQEDQNSEVKFAYNYGDHWRTEVAADVTEVVVGYTEASEYHRMDKVTDDPVTDSPAVVILR